MSWDSYISDHLMVTLPNGKTLSHAAIIGQDGGIWAKDGAFPNITADEVGNIVKGFDDEEALTDSGMMIGGEKYLIVRGEPGSVIRGRKGDDGVCIKKTITAIVVGIYGQGVQPGDCNMIVEGLGDYLKEMDV